MMYRAFEISKSKAKSLDLSLKKDFNLALKDESFVKLVNSLKVDENILIKNTSKLQNTVCELNNCKNCKGLSNCKNRLNGHVNYPDVKEEVLVFSYVPCKYKKQDSKVNSVKFYETPKSLVEAKMSEILIDDKARIKVIKYIKDFIVHYQKGMEPKGLYLHGSFGCGKSYMLSALLNELSKNGYKCINIYYPSLLKRLKESFNNNFEEVLSELNECDILLIDDIGAENNTSWARDEILGPLLQYRMDNKLATFFTSNFNIDELESHLKQTNVSVDAIKARRIIERIKQLTIDIELIGENRRS